MERDTNGKKLIWWLLSAMLALVFALAGIWANALNAQVDRIDDRTMQISETLADRTQRLSSVEARQESSLRELQQINSTLRQILDMHLKKE